MDAPIIAPASTADRPGRTLLPVAELVAAVGLLEAELWGLRAWTPAWVSAPVFGLVVAIMVASSLRRKREGFAEPVARSSRARSWLEAGVTTLTLSLAMVAAAMIVGDSNESFEFMFLRKRDHLAGWVLGKFVAAAVQQLALQWFLVPTCREITRNRTASFVMASAIFGLVHLPSPALVAITAIGSMFWVSLYDRGPRLGPLVASHMVLAALAHGMLPERLTFDMRVGQAAVADLDRFASLADPRVRLVARRLKDHRDLLRRFTSAEYYRAQGGTDEGLVRGLFRDVLRRPAADADVAHWRDQHLPNFREQVPKFFLGSDEFAQIAEADRAADAARR